MELIEKQKQLQRDAKELSMEINQLKSLVDKKTVLLSRILAEKRRVEEELTKIEVVPTGRSGKPRSSKPLDVNTMSDAAANALLEKLLKLQQTKGLGK